MQSLRDITGPWPTSSATLPSIFFSFWALVVLSPSWALLLCVVARAVGLSGFQLKLAAMVGMDASPSSPHRHHPDHPAPRQPIILKIEKNENHPVALLRRAAFLLFQGHPGNRRDSCPLHGGFLFRPGK